MAYWIEIRCANSGEAATEFIDDDRCWSHDNIGLGDLVDENVDMKKHFTALKGEAIRAGFVLSKKGWICPFCAKQIQSS